MNPRESLFHALQGDLYAMDENFQAALRSYETAITANPGLFYGHLRKGQVSYRLDREQTARDSLELSLELMPTAEAHYLLGMLDKKRGNNQSAMEHFRVAAGSESEAGKSANRELVRMDLSSNPSKYIASRAAVDQQNGVWVQFANRTAVPIEDIVIGFAWLDDQGRTRQGSRTFSGPLQAGAQDQLDLGIRLSNPGELNQRVRVQITAARVAD